ncbi:MAG: DUF1365 domain-containing protein [Candidatus Dormiibacterota bacterium]
MRRSALYEGTVMHQRTGAHASGFVRRIAMPLLDLDEVDDLTDLAPLWRAERPAPITYRRRDFMGDPDTSLRTTVLDLVERRAGFRPDGPVRLLALHRSWGWCFNPIALYYCFDAAETLQAVVADVTNTPWGESHAYVLDVRGGLGDVKTEQKQLHVSPFLPMDLTYRFRLTAPGKRCGLGITVMSGESVVFRAGLSLRRRPLTRSAIARLLVRHPLMTHRVSAGIYTHAARLWLRRTPYVAHSRVAA